MDKNNSPDFESMMKIRITCVRILQDHKDVTKIKDLQNLIVSSSPAAIRTVEIIILSTFYPYLKDISKDKCSFKTSEKELIVNTLKNLFDKVTVDKLSLFFNIYGFLLHEVYDLDNHTVLNIPEEYKLSIVQCTTSLVKSLSFSLISALYVKENAPKLCQMLYVVLDMAKSERYKSLRIASINCLMTIARVLDDNDFNDWVIRNQVAEMFLFFLPGIASQLKSVALSDEKVGHAIPAIALKAWGRIVTLLMQDYNASDEKIDLSKFQATLPNNEIKTNRKWKNEKELKKYLDQTKRSPQWYIETDTKLQQIIIEFRKLTQHSHQNVKLELVNMSSLLIDNCSNTMPNSINHLVEIIIALSEDDDHLISNRSRNILENLSSKFTTNEFKILFENLEEGFYNAITSLPRKFNGIDEKEQLAALNLLIGYLTLFATHNLTRVLHSTVHLNQLVLTLIHISELDKSSISLLEEYTVQSFELTNLQMPWKKFRYFKMDSVQIKLKTICHLLAKFEVSRIISNSLLDILENDYEHKKEAIFLLNELVSGININDTNFNVVKNLILTYTDQNFWYLPLHVMIDENGYEHNLGDIQSNIVQVCLLTEGIGKIAVTLKKNFEPFMLKTLYLILERAGSGNPLIRTAGIAALSNITKACEYSSITDLINNNTDYFSFHLEKRLNKVQVNEGVLSVLAVLMRYSSENIIISASDIIEELLMHLHDKYKEANLNTYLHIFKIFIQSLHRWYNIKIEIAPFKTKIQKQEEFEEFKVSGIDSNENFSDDVMGKSAEELYKEDLEKTKNELEAEVNEPQAEEFKKPDPPTHIKLTVTILSRILHFLPAKDKARKLLVLEILKDGLEVIREWEDELLPIVHQIWSPLVNRFKEVNEPLIINYSFQLLMTLARLSKEFIRSRTAKDVLPSILHILQKLSETSYLKDKGSAYRYTLRYKLQLTLIEHLARLIVDLDMLENHVNMTMDVIFKYLSDKQPIPLQMAAVDFVKTLLMYDPKLVNDKLKSWLQKDLLNEYVKNQEMLKTLGS